MERQARNRLTRIEKRFDVIFEYHSERSEITVHRLDWSKTKSSDLLDTIDLDEPITKTQFDDICTCWCDRHAA